MTINLTNLFDSIRPSLFHDHLTQPQVSGITTILGAWDKWSPSAPTAYIAYSLSTTYHETARTMQPIEEYGKGRGHSYGIPTGPWHQVYDGRGDVQLTWKANYAKATTALRALGVLTADQDLVKSPSLAMEPDVAAAILIVGMEDGWFTGRKLSQYFGPSICNPVGARAIINGSDQAHLIASYFSQFLKALKA